MWLLTLTAGLLSGVLAAPAYADGGVFTRPLTVGDEGSDVLELQIRVAGWFERDDQRQLKLSGVFDQKTANALKAFQKHYDLEVTGKATQADYDILLALEDVDGSTDHFDFTEFDQNSNSQCGKKANRYAGTFKGGPIPKEMIKENVRRLMWRLEALRAKSGDKPIGINSGYRSLAYNECIGGASLSQHLFGAAIDIRIAEVHNHDSRDNAKRSQFSGIACYSTTTHSHLDIRLDNIELPEAMYWYWPETDDKGRELADDGNLCSGEKAYFKQKKEESNMLRSVRAWQPTPTVRDIEAFRTSGDYYGGLAD